MLHVVPILHVFSNLLFFDDKARHSTTYSTRNRIVFDRYTLRDSTCIPCFVDRDAIFVCHIQIHRNKYISHKSINVCCSEELRALASLPRWIMRRSLTMMRKVRSPAGSVKLYAGCVLRSLS